MRKFVPVAAVALVPALSSMVALAPAHAESRAPAQRHSSAVAGPGKIWNVATFEFKPRGDRVELCDTKADGRGARLRIYNVTKDPDVREYTLTNTRGNNHCITRSAADGQPWNMAEKHCFRFTIWSVDDGERVSEKYWWQYRNYNNDGPRLCTGVD